MVDDVTCNQPELKSSSNLNIISHNKHINSTSSNDSCSASNTTTNVNRQPLYEDKGSNNNVTQETEIEGSINVHTDIRNYLQRSGGDKKNIEYVVHL